MPRLVVIALILSVIAVAGCLGDGTGPRFAYVVDSNGEWLKQTPTNIRQVDQNRLAEDVTELIDGAARIAVTIDELPTYAEGDDDLGVWLYHHPTIAIRIDTPGDALPDEAQIAAAVDDRLGNRLQDHTYQIPVTVTAGSVAAVPASSADSAAPARGAASADSGQSVPPPSAGTAQRTYVVQAGDTLADISAVFYGTTERWRDIVTANPGLKPYALKPGTELIIP